MRGILRPLPSKASHRETIEKIQRVSRARTCGDERLRELVKREVSGGAHILAWRQPVGLVALAMGACRQAPFFLSVCLPSASSPPAGPEGVGTRIALPVEHKARWP